MDLTELKRIELSIYKRDELVNILIYEGDTIIKNTFYNLLMLQAKKITNKIKYTFIDNQMQKIEVLINQYKYNQAGGIDEVLKYKYVYRFIY